MIRRRSGRERAIGSVPGWILILLCAAFAGQASWHWRFAQGAPGEEQLPPAPRSDFLRLVAAGEGAAVARAGMLWLQAFDASASNSLPYQQLDYARLTGWLGSLLALDPRSLYPVFVAARVYAENPDPAKQRQMLEFVHTSFLADPDRRWPALAHAALLAKHQLKDLPLARRYAADLQGRTKDPSMPLWARQMEAFILEDMNELEAAKVLLGGLLATGRIRDEGERRFLERRLKALEARIQQQGKR